MSNTQASDWPTNSRFADLRNFTLCVLLFLSTSINAIPIGERSRKVFGRQLFLIYFSFTIYLLIWIYRKKSVSKSKAKKQKYIKAKTKKPENYLEEAEKPSESYLLYYSKRVYSFTPLFG